MSTVLRLICFVLGAMLAASCAGNSSQIVTADYRSTSPPRQITPQSLCYKNPNGGGWICSGRGDNPCTITSETVKPPISARTTIGVGEQVTLTSNGTGWSVDGYGSIVGIGHSATLTAGPVPEDETVTVAGGSACQSNTIDFNVIAPSGMLYVRTQGIYHRQGRPDIGMKTLFYLQPDGVSFASLYQLEKNVTGFGSGAFYCLNGQSHNPNPTPISVGNDIPGLGSPVNAVDTDYSGDCGYSSPFAAGVGGWNIPDWYSVGSTGGQYFFTTVLQEFALDSSGNLTVQKGPSPAAYGTTTVGSANSSY